MRESTREVPLSPRRSRGWELTASHNLEERERAREALMLTLSDDSLTSILKDLRNFREGKPLQPKVQKILEGVLRENTLRKMYR